MYPGNPYQAMSNVDSDSDSESHESVVMEENVIRQSTSSAVTQQQDPILKMMADMREAQKKATAELAARQAKAVADLAEKQDNDMLMMMAAIQTAKQGTPNPAPNLNPRNV
jgi:CO dehydrogenase nickel-insertion accessory protein CooC1